jgi:hypothetical protein
MNLHGMTQYFYSEYARNNTFLTLTIRQMHNGTVFAEYAQSDVYQLLILGGKF